MHKSSSVWFSSCIMLYQTPGVKDVVAGCLLQCSWWSLQIFLQWIGTEGSSWSSRFLFCFVQASPNCDYIQTTPSNCENDLHPHYCCLVILVETETPEQHRNFYNKTDRHSTTEMRKMLSCYAIQYRSIFVYVTSNKCIYCMFMITWD